MSTAREIYRWSQRDRYGRIAITAIWFGVSALLPPLALLRLQLELRRHPLTEATA